MLTIAIADRAAERRNCGHCKAEVKVAPSRVREFNYCNQVCYHEHRRVRKTATRRDRGIPRAPRAVQACLECGELVSALESDVKRRGATGRFCSAKHKNQWAGRRGGAPSAPIGSVKMQNRGYVLERTERGWEMQHRVRMAEHLGRPLRPEENVHHLNAIRSDNRLDNLELWTKVQPAGARVEDLVDFAREILDRYGDLFPKSEG